MVERVEVVDVSVDVVEVGVEVVDVVDCVGVTCVTE